MNKEIEKAMNRKESKTFHFYGWWIRNGYKVKRVVLFPIWVYMCGKEKINNYLNSKCEWSEEKANEILSYYIPRRSIWNAEEEYFLFWDNGENWSQKFNLKRIKIKDRRWWKNNAKIQGWKMKNYLIEKFEMEGFKKIIGDMDNGFISIYFKKIEK